MKGTITSKREFDAVYAHGERSHGDHAVLFYLPAQTFRSILGEPGESPRIGIVASRRVGNAVARNRAKRVLRVAVAPLLDDAEPGCRIVIVARRSLVDDGVRTQEMSVELRSLWARVRRAEGLGT